MNTYEWNLTFVFLRRLRICAMRRYLTKAEIDEMIEEFYSVKEETENGKWIDM